MAFIGMTWFRWWLDMKNFFLEKNKYEIKYQELKAKEKLKDLEERLKEKREEIAKINK